MQVKDCIGCGYCCLTSACFLAVVTMDSKGMDCSDLKRCPFLIWSDEQHRYLCKLVVDGDILPAAIYVGFGCCSPLNTWRKNVVFRG